MFEPHERIEKVIMLLMQASRELREVCSQCQDGSTVFKVASAARYLALSKQTLRRKEESGELVPQRGPNNKYRYYTQKQLDDYLASKGIKAFEPPTGAVEKTEEDQDFQA